LVQILKRREVSKKYYLTLEDKRKEPKQLSKEIYYDMLRFWYGSTWEDLNNLKNNVSDRNFTYGPFTNVFFDHKVADPISSFSYVLMLGLVPTFRNYLISRELDIEDWGGECFLDNSCEFDIQQCDEDKMPCVNKKSFKNRSIKNKDKFFNLINLCESYHNKIKEMFVKECERNIRCFTISLEEIPDRCPKSWYKDKKWYL